MINITYFLNDIDITKYIQSKNIELREERKIIGADTLILADYTITIIDDFNPFETNSPFYHAGNRLRNMLVKSYWNDGIRFKGFIDNIKYKDNRTLDILIKPNISKNMLSTVDQYVNDNQTPAYALQYLLEWLGLQSYIDYSSFNTASILQDYFGLHVNITINEDDTVTLQQIINQIADGSCADIYLGADGKIYYLQYTNQKYINPANILKEKQVVNFDISRNYDVINKYTMTTQWGSYTSEDSFAPESIRLNGVHKKDLNFDTSQKVVPTTLAGMQWGGQNWVQRGKDIRWVLNCDCIGLDFYPNLREYFKVEWLDNTNFEIINIIENSQSNITKIVGLSV